MWVRCSNTVPTPPPWLSSLLFLVTRSHPFPPLHPCSSCRAAPGYSLKSSAHPVHPSPPWSPPPGCWAPSRCCAPTSLPFLWSPSHSPHILKVCALSSSIQKDSCVSHRCVTWPQCEGVGGWWCVFRRVCVREVWGEFSRESGCFKYHHFVSACLPHLLLCFSIFITSLFDAFFFFCCCACEDSFK